MINVGPVTRIGVYRVRPESRALATSSWLRFHKTLDQRERPPSQKLPAYPARTRFAPSPTGYLHLGSLRTALFNFLLAKATGGQFLLRVEDTDQKRTIADAEERLIQDLKWAGLQWDEGPDNGGPYGPYKQSERTALYQEHAQQLLNSQHAYRCFCSSERTGSAIEGLGRDCALISGESSKERAASLESHAIRLRMPRQENGYNDLVYGTVGGGRGPRRVNKHLGQGCFADPVLIKSDGFPTYHLANVVDDHHMKITHVIRAAEWMPSTPKHIVMYEALGWEPPLYAHVGLLQNNERQKYSKRKGDEDLDMRSLAMNGAFPEALTNYVALHGWSHDLGDDFLRMNDLVKNFDLKFTKGNTVIVPTKLGYLQRRYAEKYAEEGGSMFENMVQRVLANVKDASMNTNRPLICPSEELQPRVSMLLKIEANKYTFPKEFSDRISYFFFSESRKQDDRLPFHPLILEHLEKINDSFTEVSRGHWEIPRLTQAMGDLHEFLGSSQKIDAADPKGTARTIRSQLQTFMRWAVSYGHPGPSIVQTMQILGRDVTVGRLAEATALLKDSIQRDGASTPA